MFKVNRSLFLFFLFCLLFFFQAKQHVDVNGYNVRKRECRSGLVLSASACGVTRPRFESHRERLVYGNGCCVIQPWARAAPYCSAYVNSALHPIGVAKSSTSFGWGKGGNVTSAGWQVTLCDPIWHMSSISGVAGLLTKGEPLYMG